MKTAIKYILFSLIIILILPGCSPKRPQLIVDEIYLSKHVVGPPFLRNIKFIPSLVEEEGNIPKAQEIVSSLSPEVRISHSYYCPQVIIKVTKEGKTEGFLRNSLENREGYIETMLKDSMISYFNSQIGKMNYNKPGTTVYNRFDCDGSVYTGTEYFAYIKKDGKVNIHFCFNREKTPKYIISFIDSLYNYMGKVKLKDKPPKYFRMDTLIVLKTEELRDENY